MILRNLAEVSTEEIVQGLLAAFSKYFVVLPSEVTYWEERFTAARVDRRLSFGMFDGNKLVGFIINGIDRHEEKHTAYNSGTGVLPEYRGKGIVDKLYAHALPVFRKQGVEKCLLEVIRENERAIKVYHRIGFKIKRSLSSWKGKFPEPISDYHLQKIDFQQVSDLALYRSGFYSWDHLSEAVALSKASKKTYLVTDRNKSVIGYFVVGAGGQVVQLNAVKEEDLSEVAKSLSNISQEIKFGNIPQEREDLLSILRSFDFENTVNQYEMEFFL